MIIKIQLTESEIRGAIKRAIQEKLSDLPEFSSYMVTINGSVKFKNKYVRKDIKRIVATIEVTK